MPELKNNIPEDPAPGNVNQHSYSLVEALFRRRYLIGLLYILIILIGGMAWFNIPVELTPDLQLPSVSVSYSWGRTSPLVMEQEITRKVETVATRLRDVTRIRSSTSEGSSSVTIEFAKNAPIDFRIIELREHLLLLRDQWPVTVSQPNVSKRVPQELESMKTFLSYSLSGNRDSYTLSEIAENQIKRRLLGIDGLADIDMSGSREPAIVLEFDQHVVESLNITPAMVATQISERLSRRSAGWIAQADGRINLFAPPQIETLAEIRNLPLLVPRTTRQLRISDIADVTIQDQPVKSIRRINGNTALTLYFVKESGADALVLADHLRAEMDEITRSLPDGVVLRLESDSTEDLRKQLSDLRSDAFLSLGVVFIFLLLFIRRVRAPILILLCIVFSVLLSVTVLYLLDITLNIITLAALTITLGMLVDNAIVVYEQLNSRKPTSREGRVRFYSNEVLRAVVPVIGSTFTTIAIFIPLLFSLENLRIYLIPLATGVSIALVASVLISLSWMPYAMIWLVPLRKESDKASKRIPGWWQPKRWFMKYMLIRHRMRWLLYTALILFIGLPVYLIKEPSRNTNMGMPAPAQTDSSWVAKARKTYIANRDKIEPYVGGLGYRFYKNTYFGEPFNRAYRENIAVRVTTPLGTPIEELNKIALTFEEVANTFSHAIDYYETNVSEYSGTNMTFFFKEPYLYRREPYVMKGEMMYLAAYTGNAAIGVSGFGDGYYSGGGGGISSFQIQIQGYSLSEIDGVADDLKNRLESNRRVQNVELNRSYTANNRLWHYVLNFDDTELYLKNLTRREVISSLQLDINPSYSGIGFVELDGLRHQLITRFKARTRYQDEFGEKVRRVGNAYMKVDEVANIDKQQVMSRIDKENQAYSRTVSFEYLGSYRNGSDFLDEVLEDLPVPVGITAGKPTYRGLLSASNTTGLGNFMTFFMAIFCVWMVVSALLESWSASWVVLFSIPLSAIGIMYGVMSHDIAFDRGAMSGALLCIGVVVNNSILFMHRRLETQRYGINGLRAWLYVYRDKSRSVFLTTITTVGGLLPLIIFGGSDYWRNMSIVICWGLAGSTIFLLLLIGLWDKSVKKKTPATIEDTGSTAH